MGFGYGKRASPAAGWVSYRSWILPSHVAQVYSPLNALLSPQLIQIRAIGLGLGLGRLGSCLTVLDCLVGLWQAAVVALASRGQVMVTCLELVVTRHLPHYSLVDVGYPLALGPEQAGSLAPTAHLAQAVLAVGQ